MKIKLDLSCSLKHFNLLVATKISKLLKIGPWASAQVIG